MVREPVASASGLTTSLYRAYGVQWHVLRRWRGRVGAEEKAAPTGGSEIEMYLDLGSGFT